MLIHSKALASLSTKPSLMLLWTLGVRSLLPFASARHAISGGTEKDHRWNGQAIKTVDDAMKDCAESQKYKRELKDIDMLVGEEKPRENTMYGSVGPAGKQRNYLVKTTWPDCDRVKLQLTRRRPNDHRTVVNRRLCGVQKPNGFCGAIIIISNFAHLDWTFLRTY